MDEAAESDDAVLYGDTDLSGIDAGLPIELPLDISTNVLVRTHGSLRSFTCERQTRKCSLSVVAPHEPQAKQDANPNLLALMQVNQR